MEYKSEPYNHNLSEISINGQKGMKNKVLFLPINIGLKGASIIKDYMQTCQTVYCLHLSYTPLRAR